MPIIYLSPSTQENNYYVTGGTEEQYMNLLADKMVPYLDASGIRYSRNTPSMTAASSIAASNAGNYDLHLALHSNAAPEGKYGTVRGSIVFYYPGSTEGRRAAEIIADGLKAIYPIPNLVQAQSTTSIGEVRRVRAPSVFIELAYHDNEADANWITGNLDAIARNIVLSLTEYFGIPFYQAELNQPAMVDVSWGVLNIRAQPNTRAAILAQAPDGASLTVLNRSGGWYLVNYNGTIGYANGDFITLV
ncbi:SH3 domain-containing protein [Pseudoflavonifractor phocaeensis]|uniref:SH3 domain-containing protein n=1 Tax=Pseudoflavonifractor phocaeensis TaxID=1870988 RepID=UPI001F2ADAAA|nr:SH3 domain-containing protein [Pseudoflavonifractor phocaeensis]MCF2662279.1 N-acetylmuramoyl-L-alanine amidase [Pseudoflavonifractor phocaeensis]